ncbi:Aromatic-ring hydroxylase-like protein [Metarhizium album ARSEF 1941]|uniref:Aromatic-ring hydroxylase-like protein n=1 Tax=Metarhizium album (strain ARSEF 1941) TaxID=1081103 RepID=A0A0B2X732_METAS|nr:Aromatic-ring hydroxylase-like protein [Metarhizium album ARSEF 1941]KHO01583.1 Aromatic-ring hydroxylase-like protein [Metarhizium album ARSEF 1941]
MTVSTTARNTVAIIGAGLTGLLAAHGLQQNGFRAVVFEREASIDARDRDWTMLVHWAMPIFEKLVPKDIIADLKSAVCNPYLDFNNEVESIPCYNGVTGDLLFRSPLPNARRVSRQALRRLLARRVDIRWNAPLKHLVPTNSGVQIRLEDGSVFDCDYVLGADGSSSKVREFLLGPDVSRPRGSGFQFATGITKFGDAEKTDAIVQAHPVAALMMGTASVGAVGVMSADNPADESNWTIFWTKIWNGEAVHLRGNDALTYVREKTTPLRDVFQHAIDWTPEDSNVFIDEMKYWNPVPWDNHGGRVTLAGDAAHPMLIYRGQGFQHSITDVDNYVKALTGLKTLSSNNARREAVMASYDDEMIRRGAKAVQESLAEARKSFDLDTVKKMLMATRGHAKSES